MSENHIPNSIRTAVTAAVYLAQRESGRSGDQIVHSALSVCRSELVAAVGERAAAALLRSLAAALEQEVAR